MSRLSYKEREQAHAVTHLSAYGHPIDLPTADLVRRYIVELEYDLADYGRLVGDQADEIAALTATVDELLGDGMLRPLEAVHVEGGLL